ncbi:DUF1173 domain-containing protein [Agrobacterium tumefaciens]|uniref:DUF1173 domain-containing protein n=1 Tax=Agrobacterium tumefaciens TaxID=358 RepID=UPI001BACF15B|nr:DUF1173 domain-containing protein [Agrobacterium tumefaciens]
MYQVAGKMFGPTDPKLKDALAAVYGSATRPKCMCRPDGVEMYVAKIGQLHVIKRMPHSGAHHAASCDSYEPPAELSGVGEVMGGAIQTNLEDGVTTIKFDFALAKTGNRAAPAPSGAEHDSVKTDGKKLTLRGTLHYLLDEAGLTRWSPAMENKRNWWVLRKYLLEAAADKVAKGSSVADLLYIPESFDEKKKDEIKRRRMTVFNQLSKAEGSSRRLMLVVGEVKEMGDARFGKKMTLKHQADAPLMMNEDLYKRLLKRFENELMLWDGNPASHLLVVGTFGVSAAGVASLEEASLVLVNENWLPYESVDELMLLDALTKQRRRFTKGLRYNLASTTPLASAVLSDTDEPVALYIKPFGGTEQYTKELSQLIEESQLKSWEWATADEIPALPPISLRK